jgi:hydroxypyruvate reductase
MQSSDNPNGVRDLKKIATDIFSAGIAAVDPARCVKQCLRYHSHALSIGHVAYTLNKIDNIYLIGFGKASAAMALPVEAMLGDRITDGLIITKYGHGVVLRHCRVMEAGHPVPDDNGARAAAALMDLVGAAHADDLIICMISGGGSALTPAPAHGIDLADKQETTRLLLACGADIHEINTIRKHLSTLKGGQLCRRANGAAMVSLILSDVIGDDLDIIASGATAPDRSSFDDCREILSRYGLLDQVPKPVSRHLSAGCRGQVEETPKPGSDVFGNVYNHIVGSISHALTAAENEARRQGFTPLVLSSTIQGEAREVGKVLSAVAREVGCAGRPIQPPACLLSGGETTVKLKGNGKGGRNMELALAAGIELADAPRTLLLSAGTDGTDGPTDAAGAFADGSTLFRADSLNLSAYRHLDNNDAYPFFQALGDLLVTGPTRTNVMDLQIALIDAVEAQK